MTEDEMVGCITDSMHMRLSNIWELVMDRDASCAVVHGVAKSRTQLNDFTFTTAWKESYDQPRHHIKKQRQYFVNKGPSNQGYDISSHVWV